MDSKQKKQENHVFKYHYIRDAENAPMACIAITTMKHEGDEFVVCGISTPPARILDRSRYEWRPMHSTKKRFRDVSSGRVLKAIQYHTEGNVKKLHAMKAAIAINGKDVISDGKINYDKVYERIIQLECIPKRIRQRMNKLVKQRGERA